MGRRGEEERVRAGQPAREPASGRETLFAGYLALWVRQCGIYGILQRGRSTAALPHPYELLWTRQGGIRGIVQRRGLTAALSPRTAIGLMRLPCDFLFDPARVLLVYDMIAAED